MSSSAFENDAQLPYDDLPDCSQTLLICDSQGEETDLDPADELDSQQPDTKKDAAPTTEPFPLDTTVRASVKVPLASASSSTPSLSQSLPFGSGESPSTLAEPSSSSSVKRHGPPLLATHPMKFRGTMHLKCDWAESF
jgi:hypothetical protein